MTETRIDTQSLEGALERLVDRSSVGAVVEALAAVCVAKSEHIIANWQDMATGRMWGKAANQLERAARRLPV